MSFLKKYYDSVDKYRSPMQAGGLTLLDIVRPIYDKGCKDGSYEGKKEGYLQASNEYEKKLLAQAKEFKEQSQLLRMNSKAKDALMRDYERYIEQQEKIIDKLSNEKRELLYVIKREYNSIVNI